MKTRYFVLLAMILAGCSSALPSITKPQSTPNHGYQTQAISPEFTPDKIKSLYSSIFSDSKINKLSVLPMPASQVSRQYDLGTFGYSGEKVVYLITVEGEISWPFSRKQDGSAIMGTKTVLCVSPTTGSTLSATMEEE